MNSQNDKTLLGVVLVMCVVLFAAYMYKKKEMTVAVPPVQQQQGNSPWNQWPNNPGNGGNPGVPSIPNTPIPQPKSYQEAVQIAKQLNRQILLFFHADWCTWCKKMERETLSDGSVKSAMSKYVFYLVNADNEKTVVSKYFTSPRLPCYVIANNNETVSKTGEGFKSVGEFLQWLDNNPTQPSLPPNISPPNSPDIEGEDDGSPSDGLFPRIRRRTSPGGCGPGGCGPGGCGPGGCGPGGCGPGGCGPGGCGPGGCGPGGCGGGMVIGGCGGGGFRRGGCCR